MTAITLTDGTATVSLNPDLYWDDEFDWVPVAQSVATGLTGKPIIQIGIRQGARPITLRNPRPDQGTITRGQLAQLYTWASNPATTLTLTLRGIAYPVRFRHDGDGPFTAEPFVYRRGIAPADRVLATLRFMTIPE